MIKKLKFKFVLTNMLLVSLVLLVTFIVVYESTRERLERESISLLQRTVSQGDMNVPLKEELGPSLQNSDFKPMPTFTVTLDAGENITEAKGALFDLSDREALNEIVALCLKSDSDSGIIADENLRYLKQGISSGTRIAFVDRSFETGTLSSLLKTSILVGTGSLAAFFLISLFLARLALRPAAKAWEQQKQFVADASHELKTPLTVILANTGILLSHKEQTVGEQAKWIEYIQTEAARMSTLVENLLFLAKTDDVKSRPVLTRVNISDLVWNSILPFESVAFEQNKNLESDIEPDLFINGDEYRLKQLVGILLDNGCKYANDKGTITVKLSENSEHRVVLAVNNTGSTIPRDQVEHIFERFFRVDKSRARQQGGYGLGLAIADSIVKMHQARISVQSTPEAGTTFAVTFPGSL